MLAFSVFRDYTVFCTICHLLHPAGGDGRSTHSRRDMKHGALRRSWCKARVSGSRICVFGVAPPTPLWRRSASVYVFYCERWCASERLSSIHQHFQQHSSTFSLNIAWKSRGPGRASEARSRLFQDICHQTGQIARYGNSFMDRVNSD